MLFAPVARHKMSTAPLNVTKLASRHHHRLSATTTPAAVAVFGSRNRRFLHNGRISGGGKGRDEVFVWDGSLWRPNGDPQLRISEIASGLNRFEFWSCIRPFSKDSRASSSNKGLRVMKNLLLLSLFSCACGGSVLLWSYWQLRNAFDNMLGYSLYKNKKNYLYPFDPGDVRFFIKKHCFIWLPSKLVTTPLAWKLYQEILSGGFEREKAIAKLSCLDNLMDSECLYFALTLDLPTSLALAHSGADPRLFVSPPVCAGPGEGFKAYFGRMFRNVLDPLPVENIHYNLNIMYRSALRAYLPTEEEEQQFYGFDMYTGFDETPVLKSNPQPINESRFLKVCLQATVSHTRDPSQLKNISKADLLELLVVIAERYSENVEIMSLILKILANTSCDPSYAEDIRSSGCLRILVECSRSKDVKLVLPAKRALHNLDGESSKHLLLSGIYQLYPDFRIDESVFDYDIVFIHGILGGAFRTWRQQDKDATLEDESSSAPKNTGDMQRWVGAKQTLVASKYIFRTPIENPEEAKRFKIRTEQEDGSWKYSDKDIDLDEEHLDSPLTQCWPRDWLPDDCPNARIIAVDFDSFATHWSGFCPVETTKRSLKDRSNELLEKLHAAGVGERPIIWVTHSMGGLLAKSLLCQAAISKKEYQNICQNTKGVVFCSVPHHGSYIALANSPRRYIFMPTEEALELTNSDNSLTLLHERFKRLWRAYKFKVLSFGEMLETKSVFKVAFKMVPFSSADPDIGDFYPVNLNHLNTCKPHCRGSFVYRKIVEFIHKITDK